MPSVWQEVSASVSTCSTTPAMVLVSLYLLLLPELLQYQQEKHQRDITPERNNTRLTKFIQGYLLALGKKLGINSLDEFISYINQEQELTLSAPENNLLNPTLNYARFSTRSYKDHLKPSFF